MHKTNANACHQPGGANLSGHRAGSNGRRWAQSRFKRPEGGHRAGSNGRKVGTEQVQMAEGGHKAGI